MLHNIQGKLLPNSLKTSNIGQWASIPNHYRSWNQPWHTTPFDHFTTTSYCCSLGNISPHCRQFGWTLEVKIGRQSWGIRLTGFWLVSESWGNHWFLIGRISWGNYWVLGGHKDRCSAEHNNAQGLYNIMLECLQSSRLDVVFFNFLCIKIDKFKVQNLNTISKLLILQLT